MRLTGIVCVAALAVAGCSDPKEASKGNFETAINAWIEKNPPCLSIPRSNVRGANANDAPFPRYLNASPVTAQYAVESRARERAPFDAMVDAGLMKVEEATVSVKPLFGNQNRDVPVRAYDLTDAGKKTLSSEGEKTAFSSPSQRFCYGTPTVDEIVQFTEPADAMGDKISQVSYRYHLKDLPDWARNEEMQTAFPQLKKDLADSIDGKAAVILTNEGWVHERASKL